MRMASTQGSYFGIYRKKGLRACKENIYIALCLGPKLESALASNRGISFRPITRKDYGHVKRTDIPCYMCLGPKLESALALDRGIANHPPVVLSEWFLAIQL